MPKRSAIVIATAAVGAFAVLGAQSAAAATIQVTNTNDAGAGSLRVAINQANQLVGPDHIVIGATGTIPLQLGLPVVTSATVIRGPGPNDLSLDGSASTTYAALRVHPGLGQPGYCYAPARRCRVIVRGVSIEHARAGILLDHGTLDVIDTTLSGNANGIEENCCAPHRLHVIDSTLSDNDTGIVGPEGGQPTGVLGSTLRGNRVGIENSNAPLYVSQTTLKDNTFGITNEFGTVAINRSTLARNDVVAVSTQGQTIPRGVVKITQSTLKGGANGIAIIVGAGDVATLRSSIVAKSNSSPYRNCDGVGQVHSRGFNLADDGSCNLSRQDDHPNTEPLLRPLGNYGGPTKTFALPKTSPAIDAGRVAGTAQTDQRGLPRMVNYPGVPTAMGGDDSDIGAFELQAP